MDGEKILLIIMMIGMGLGMGALFYGIGVWASRRKDPMHFWSGSTVDPNTLTDVPAYNRENAKMWKTFSMPFWLIAVFGIVSIFDGRFTALFGILISISCTVGIGWLIVRYNRIYKKYKKQ